MTLPRLGFLALLLLPTARDAQETGSLAQIVEAEVRQAGQRETTEIWGRAQELRAAESLGPQGELDRILDQVLSGGIFRRARRSCSRRPGSRGTTRMRGS